MNILLTIHHDLEPDSGAPGTVLKLGEAYQNQGHKVVYFSFNDLPKHFPSLAKTVLFPEFLASQILFNKKYKKVDVIDASTSDAWLWGSLFRRFWKNPPLLVTRSHGLEHAVHNQILESHQKGDLTLSWKYPIYHGGLHLWEVSQSLRCADAVFLLNRQDKRYLESKINIDTGKIHIVSNGIPDYLLDLDISFDVESQTCIRIAQIGTYIERKGTKYSSSALNVILKKFPNTEISFLGTMCPPEKILRDFDATLHSRLKIIPKFEHSQLSNLLQGHQIKVFTPLSEGFGKALVEAMACGLAPVSSTSPGPLEIVRDGYDALVVPTKDSLAIQRALEKLITQPLLLQQIRSNAYKTAQNYSWKQIAAERLDIYQQALLQNRKSS